MTTPEGYYIPSSSDRHQGCILNHRGIVARIAKLTGIPGVQVRMIIQLYLDAQRVSLERVARQTQAATAVGLSLKGRELDLPTFIRIPGLVSLGLTTPAKPGSDGRDIEKLRLRAWIDPNLEAWITTGRLPPVGEYLRTLYHNEDGKSYMLGWVGVLQDWMRAVWQPGDAGREATQALITEMRENMAERERRGEGGKGMWALQALLEQAAGEEAGEDARTITQEGEYDDIPF